MFGALRDCVVPMTKVRHLSCHQVLLDAFDTEISNHLKDVSIICRILIFCLGVLDKLHVEVCFDCVLFFAL